uniref:WnmC n=1 Tax=Neisseria meningitidis TaxID=487 RepID=H6T603_NEIME|nr:WnmC [Neisseria meningitidis]
MDLTQSWDLIPLNGFLYRIFLVDSQTIDEIIEKRSFKPRKDCDNFFLVEPIDWEATHKPSDRNWRMQLQGWFFLNPIMNGFDSYPDKDRLVQFFLDLALSWWDKYKNDADDIVTSRMPSSYAWYDMSVGSRALCLAFFQNRIKVYGLDISEQNKKVIHEMAQKHIRHLSNKAVFSLNNHGIFQAHGLMALAHVFESKASIKEYATELVKRLLDNQFDENGIHLEHSPHYHFYALSAFRALLRSELYKESQDFNQKIQKAEDKCKWLIDPLKRPICVGDSILTTQNRVMFPTSDSQDFLISDFCESGYSVVRSPWSTSPELASMIFFAGAYHSKSHKHRDCLTFDWFEQGRRIIADSGKYGYKSDKYRNYFLSNKAHNSVEIEGFDILKIKPYGSAVSNPKKIADDIYQLNGTLDYPAIKHNRTLTYRPLSWVIVEDILDFARERHATQWFHLENDFNLVSSAENQLCFQRANEELHIHCLDEDLNLLLHYGDEVSMQGFLSQKDFMFDSAYAIGFKGKFKQKRILTILARSMADLDNAKEFLGVKQPDVSLPNSPLTPQIIKGERHLALSEMNELKRNHLDNKGTFQVVSDNVTFTFFGNFFQDKKKKIVFFFPGATNRSKSKFDMQRFSWSSELNDVETVFFADPTYKPNNDLSIGWFQHTYKDFGIDALEKLIRHITALKGYAQDEMVFFGSSAGGFVSLKLAERFDKSDAICINPQIYLPKYSRDFYQHLLSVCYPGLSEQEVLERFGDRIAVTKDLSQNTGRIIIFQNQYDENHMKNHIGYYLKNHNLINCRLSFENYSPENVENGLSVVIYQDEKLGHSPPSKEITLQWIQDLL